MLITEYSFLMAVFWSSVVLVILAAALKKKVFIKYFGVSSLVFIYAMCVIRLVIPIELPFVHIIELPGVVSKINDVIILEEREFAGISFKAVDLFSLIWVIGIVITAISEVILYRKALKKWVWIRKSENEQCERAFTSAQLKFNKKINVNIWRSKQVQVPMGVGVIRKQIIIPDSIKSEKQLFGVVLHEYAHFLNHDILIKVLYQIFCCVFWWNPCVYLLKKNLDQVLEIKCDLTVIDLMDKKECVEYLETILYLIQENKKNVKKNYSIPYVQLFHAKTENKIIERFQIMLDDQMRQNRRNRIPAFICMIFF